MAKELTPEDIKTRRLKSCVERFPGAETGEYSDKCCRFPKNCSPYGRIEAVQAGNLTDRDLEPPRKTVAQAMLETGLHTEQKKLEQLRVGTSFVINVRELDALEPGNRRAAMDYELGRKRVELESYVLGEKLAEDTYTDKKSYSTPKTWWDMFKVTYAMTWWLGWLVRRWPAKFEYHWFSVGVTVERFANYPEADIPLPSLGRPVPYERITRLTHRELEDLEIQAQLEAEASEKRHDVVAYSLVPETFDDLAEETGLSRQWFEDAYKYDQDFDLQSKIYIIPAGFGYNK